MRILNGTQRNLLADYKINLENLANEIKDSLSEDDLNCFKKYVKPYQVFGNNQLDDIFLIVQITINGEGQIENLTPDCTVNQQDWLSYEDEPDMQIDDVSIPLKMLTPKPQFWVSGTKTFFAVLQAQGNIWDSCKDLPEWVWNQRKFEFMLSFSMTVGGEKIYGTNHASGLISF